MVETVGVDEGEKDGEGVGSRQSELTSSNQYSTAHLRREAYHWPK